MQNIPSGLYHIWQNQKRMFVGRPSERIQSSPALGAVFCLDKPGIRCVYTYVAAITAKRESGLGCRQAAQFPVRSECVQEKRRRGRRKGSLLTRERKVGPLGIIRWEFKGGPTLRCNQASGPRSILTCLSSASER